MTRKALNKLDNRKDAMIINPDGVLQPAPLDESGEEAVDIGNWHGSAQLAEELTLKFWGSDREGRLKEHHRIVHKLMSTNGWQVARRYDFTIRKKAVTDYRHDLSTLDSVELNMVISAIAQQRAALLSSGPGTVGGFSGSAGVKRSRPPDDEGFRPSKTQKQTRCFRCGAVGHGLADCNARTTTAGSPCANPVPKKGGHTTLTSSDGSEFCFNWERGRNLCRFGAGCINLHACSLCLARDHGAASCTRRL